MGTNGEIEQGTVERGPLSMASDEVVVVPTGGGERFHRPDGPGFETACKTGFGRPVRELTVSEARERGFSPCKKSSCFGDR
jgi:hypothetical protein